MTRILHRISSPTPGFFKKIRNIGLAVAAISGTLLTAPVALPAVLLKIAGYLAVAGGVASAISQVTSTDDTAPKPDAHEPAE
jgi:hypothetical protein